MDIYLYMATVPIMGGRKIRWGWYLFVSRLVGRHYIIIDICFIWFGPGACSIVEKSIFGVVVHGLMMV